MHGIQSRKLNYSKVLSENILCKAEKEFHEQTKRDCVCCTFTVKAPLPRHAS